MEDQLVQFLLRTYPDAREIVIEELEPIPGGYSRETYRFDARVRWTDLRMSLDGYTEKKADRGIILSNWEI